MNVGLDWIKTQRFAVMCVVFAALNQTSRQPHEDERTSLPSQTQSTGTVHTNTAAVM